MLDRSACYRVSEHVPGRRVAFRFEGEGLAAGIDGGHRDVAADGGRTVLRHSLEAA